MSTKRDRSLSLEAEKKRTRVTSPTCGQFESSTVPAASGGMGKVRQPETPAVVERLSDDRYSFQGDWGKVVAAISAIEELRCNDYICIGTLRIVHKLDYLAELMTSVNGNDAKSSSRAPMGLSHLRSLSRTDDDGQSLRRSRPRSPLDPTASTRRSLSEGEYDEESTEISSTLDHLVGIASRNSHSSNRKSLVSRGRPDHASSRRRSTVPRSLLKRQPNPKTHQFLKFEEYLREDSDNAFITCGNCGFVGHTLIDCIWPDKDGSIYGCPMCNTKVHCMDECPSHKSLTDRQLCYILVLRRANKPAIRTTRAWVDHVRTAAYRDYKDLLQVGFPWTWNFGRRVQLPENAHCRPWDAYDYARNSELQHTLPRDPATRDLETVLRNPALVNERHKTVGSTERHRAGDSYVGRGFRRDTRDRSVERVPADEKKVTWESIFSDE